MEMWIFVLRADRPLTLLWKDHVSVDCELTHDAGETDGRRQEHDLSLQSLESTSCADRQQRFHEMCQGPRAAVFPRHFGEALPIY